MSTKKILLVSGNQLKAPYPVYPIGLSYLATYLRKRLHGYSIQIFDFNLGCDEDFEKVIRQTQPAFIGVSMRNVDNLNLFDPQNYVHQYKKIIEMCRRLSEAVIVLGGAGYSIFPELIYDLLQPDFGVMGEGEKTLLELIGCSANPAEYRKIEGLVYRDNGVTRSNKRHTFSENLELEVEPELVDYYWAKSGMLNIQTKRGCPYHCDFCNYPFIEGRRLRTLNPDHILATLSQLKSEKNIDYVFFTDSIFNIANTYNRQLAEKITQSGIDIRWGAYFSPARFDRESLKLYKDSGLTHIEFGTDSLSEKMLKNYNKPFTVSDVLEASAICNELDIYFAHFLILGGEGETEETLDETFENSRKIENTVFFPTVGARIYPGTTLCERSISQGLIERKEDLIESRYYISENIDLSAMKTKATRTGKRWVFMDDDFSNQIARMRSSGATGPLWEYILK